MDSCTGSKVVDGLNCFGEKWCLLRAYMRAEERGGIKLLSLRLVSDQLTLTTGLDNTLTGGR